jgi:hypothetical protein
MHAHTQVFWNKTTTPTANLAREPRVNDHHLTTSVCSFVSQERDQLTPSRIVNRFGQARASQASDVQVLNGNQTVRVRELSGKFVLKIQALVRHLVMHRRNISGGFAPPTREFLATRKNPLGLSQLHFSGPIPAWILNDPSVR